ncbi:hypothetical protein ASPSYDRAFT_129782 [Aspergillus sydowii CBS 593.65]|uniref:Uncharacterized protein n=1 Tax=Aspergillus sydowii CBS 593.65 TaxID=1036612 RepID=A0A1L9TUE8_9EURO|nr:uncharacterized protein ASPSYDRAFT_129782 [Aspergillus sydowii CBS 593.65]OJJ63005.1 hypothetical protein ASPSYDRAFT_129782 [Aspergillus sydowii CBS 593.65]
MKYFQFFLLLVLPFVALAMPAPEAVEELKSALVARQNDTGGDLGGLLGGLGDIGGTIGDIINSIGPLLDLINPNTVDQLQTIITNAAKLLNDKTTQNIINVVGSANELLTPDFVQAIGGLIDAVAPLINAIVQLISGVLGAIFG